MIKKIESFERPGGWALSSTPQVLNLGKIFGGQEPEQGLSQNN
jgi:hypothetical protein